MGVIHEEAVNRISIPGNYKEPGYRGSDRRYSARCFSRWPSSISVCYFFGVDQGCGISSCQQSMVSISGKELATRIRKGFSNIAQPSGIYCKKVGQGRNEKAAGRIK